MRTAIFITCLTDTFFPRVGTALVRVLRHFDCPVTFPEKQTCCGQPAYNSGFHDEAACLVRRMADLFANFDRVITPSASCATLVKQHGPALLDEPRVRDLADRTYEVCTFLEHELDLDFTELVHTHEPTTYHYPCHARETYTLADLQRWLSGIRDLRHPPRPDLCCGFGGVFAVDFPELSGNMLTDKLQVLAGTGAELVISNEAACTLQMAGGARRANLPLRFKHMIEIVAENLGLMGADE
jgi:L-lactate dehydrogenase complex protein LldE